MISYDEIIKYLDNFFSIFSNNNTNKFMITGILHYIISIIIIFVIIFGKIDTFWWISYIIAFITALLNYKYNGCLLLKLERKYLNDKNWYGAYNILMHNNIIKKENIFVFYNVYQFIILIIGIIRLLNYYY